MNTAHKIDTTKQDNPDRHLQLAYVPLSENGGVLVVQPEETAIRLEHSVDGRVTAHLVKKGEIPTIMNKEFAMTFISENKSIDGFSMPWIEPKKTDAATPRYRLISPREQVLSPEYQLYLANELEREIIKRSARVKGDMHGLTELTGLLPHEEEQDEH